MTAQLIQGDCLAVLPTLEQGEQRDLVEIALDNPADFKSLIVAMDQNGVIGRDGITPWHLPADLRWFRRQTLGKPVIMGRLTYDSIGRALPRRCNIVLTRSADFAPPGCSVADSAQAALDIARAALQPDGPCASADPPEIMVIGGGQIYRRFLPLAQRIYLTRVEAQVAGDTWFPPIAWEEWQVVWEERFSADDRHAWPFTCLILERLQFAAGLQPNLLGGIP